MHTNSTERDEIAKILTEFKQQSIGSTENNTNSSSLLPVKNLANIFQKKAMILVSYSNEVFEEEIVGFENSDTLNEIALIDKLDYDCLVRVFDYLPVEDKLKVGQVCTKWRDACELIWSVVKKLEYKTEWPKCQYKKEGEPCPCDTSLHNLKLKFYYLPNLFAQCGQYVQDLDITKFTDSIILTALKGCFPNLVNLKFIMYQWNHEHIKDLFYGMTKLKCLDTKWHTDEILPLTFFEALNTVANELKELVIMNVELHVDHCLNKYYAYPLSDSRLPKRVTDKSIKKFQNMQRISFTNYPMITDDSIIRILINSPNLEVINLKKTGVTFESVQHVIDTMRDRTNGTQLSASFDLPDDILQLQDNMPPNLHLKLVKESV